MANGGLYLIPASGLPVWADPDPNDQPSTRIDGGVEVEVSRRSGDWAEILCVNGWSGWVDGRLLTNAPATAPPSTLRVEVPRGGLAAWASPDPSAAPTATINAGLEIEVTERTGDWARVLCSNGWSGWVDARRLQPSVRAHSPLVLVGGALVVLSGFLPWLTAPGVSLSAWQIPVRFLVLRTPGDTHPRVGLLLMAATLVLLPYLSGRPLPRWALLALGAVGVNLALFAVSRVLRPAPHPDLGLGVLVALVGGGLLTWEYWRTRDRSAAGATA